MSDSAVRHASPEVDGAKLRDLRKRAGLTVSGLATVAGISPSYVGAIERGHRRTVAPATYLRICRSLDLTYDDLLRIERQAA